MYMGADGCGWVRWGAGGMGGHKNKADRDKNGRAEHVCGSMAGEISPNIMFFEIRRRVIQMHANGFIWVANRCYGTHGQGGNAKQHEHMHKWARMTIFCNARPLQKNKPNFGLAKNWSESITWLNSGS